MKDFKIRAWHLLSSVAILISISGIEWSCKPVDAATGNGAISGWKILNLDIDHSVSAQKKLDSYIDDRKDLYASEKAIRLWTGAKGLKVLRGAIAEWRAKYPQDNWLTFTGSGDFHQTTATLIESLPKSQQPVTIILFDNHPDWFKAPAHFHCGAWVVQALKHPFVEKVIMVAQDSEDIRGDQFRFAPFNELCKGRVEMHPLQRQSVLVPLIWRSRVAGVESSKRTWLGTKLNFATVRGAGVQPLAERLAKELAGKNVYVTMDKDVLDSADAITDWDQGTLKLSEMLGIVSKVAEKANIVGMDVCGERAPGAVRGILKSFDSGREFKRKIKNFPEATQVNERTNLEIIKLVRSISDEHKQVSGTIERPSKK